MMMMTMMMIWVQLTEFLDENADDGHRQNEKEELVGPQMDNDQ